MILAITIAIQVIRIFYGLDFNDEMQYYGQLMSLVSTNHLFATDQFLQQTAYVPLYPIFKLTYVLYGTSHLIVIGRVVFAIFLLCVYRRVRCSLSRGGIGMVTASL